MLAQHFWVFNLLKKSVNYISLVNNDRGYFRLAVCQSVKTQHISPRRPSFLKEKVKTQGQNLCRIQGNALRI